MAGSISGVRQADVLSVFIRRGNERSSSVADQMAGTAASALQRANREGLANTLGRLRALNVGEREPPIPTAPGLNAAREVREGEQILRQTSIKPAGLGSRLDVTG